MSVDHDVTFSEMPGETKDGLLKTADHVDASTRVATGHDGTTVNYDTSITVITKNVDD